MKKTFQELHDETLIAEAGDDMCSVPLEKLRSKAMRATHKKLCVDPKHWSTTDKKSKKSMWSKAAQRAASSGGHRLHNSVEEARKKKVKLPPHLAKFFDKQGNPKPKVAARIRKARALKGVKITDVTPDWMFEGEVEEGYQEIQNLANLIKSETDRLVKAAKKGDMKTVMAIYRTIGKIIK
jgi:hypothetical protein